MLESSFVSTRRIMSGFVAFSVAWSWDILLLLLILLQLINMALSLFLVFTCFLSGVEVFAGFGAKVVFGSS